MFRGVLFFHVHLVVGLCHRKGSVVQILSLAFQGECSRDRLSEAEAEMDRRNWEQRNADIALCETKRQLESQRLELYQANQWADQAQRGGLFIAM